MDETDWLGWFSRAEGVRWMGEGKHLRRIEYQDACWTLRNACPSGHSAWLECGRSVSRYMGLFTWYTLPDFL